MKRVIFLFILMGALVGALGGVSADVPLNGCATLSTSGERYYLTDDVTIPGGGCFSFASGISDVILDFQGHTITFDEGEVVNLLNPSFELGSGSTPSNWNIVGNGARVNNREFYRFGEDYTLTFSAGGGVGYAESDPIALQAGSEYVASFLVRFSGSMNSAYLSFPELGSTCSGTSLIPTYGSSTAAYWFYSCTFVPSTSGNVHVRVGVDSSITSDVIIDMVDVKPTYSGGIISTPGFGTRNNITIMNGTIVQGRSNSNENNYWGADAFSLRTFANSAFHDLDITTTGVNVFPVGVGTTLSDIDFYNNVLRVNSTYNWRREMNLAPANFEPNDGSNCIRCDVYNNTLYTMQQGIRMQGTDSRVFNNRIYHNAYITNSYAIAMRGGSVNVSVYNNTITGYGRGIHISSVDGAKVYNNTLLLGEYPNPEHPESELSGDFDSGICVHGIKLEVEPYDAEVYNNYVKTTQVAGTYPGCSLNMHFNSDPHTATYFIHDNVFETETHLTSEVDRAPASAYIFNFFNPQNVTLANNVFKTNGRRLVDFEYAYGEGFNFVSNRFESSNPNTVYLVQNSYQSGATTSRYNGVHYLNNTYGGVNQDSVDSNNNGPWDHHVEWYVDVSALNGGVPTTGAVLTIRDGNQNAVYNNVNFDGTYSAMIPEYDLVSSGGSDPGSRTNLAVQPFNVSVTYGGETQYQEVIVDSPTALTFFFGGGNPDVNSDSKINVVDLALVIFYQGDSATQRPHLDINEDGIISAADLEALLSFL